MKTIPIGGMGRLLFFIDARLVTLRWTREDLARAGGPATSTLNKANHRDNGLAARTRAALDFALGWQPGSTQSVLAGGNPTVRLSEQVETSAAKIDGALRHAQCAGTSECAEQLKHFLLDVAQRLEAFYPASERIADVDPA